MRKVIPIEMDKIRNLRFGINAISMAEQMLGRPISAFASESVGLTELRTLYFCGLVWEDKTLTLEQVGDLMDEVLAEHGVEFLGEKLTEAIMLALPAKAAEKKKQA